MQIDFPVLADMGFSYLVVAVCVIGLGRAWSSIWPWFRDVYWTNREERWTASFEATQDREKMMMKQSQSFLLALEKYQDGFAVTNAIQHKAIIEGITTMQQEMQEYKDTTTALTTMIELLLKRIEQL